MGFSAKIQIQLFIYFLQDFFKDMSTIEIQFICTVDCTQIKKIAKLACVIRAYAIVTFVTVTKQNKEVQKQNHKSCNGENHKEGFPTPLIIDFP